MGDKIDVARKCLEIQCEILKTDKGIFVKDRSSNVPWVNGHKIGKDGGLRSDLWRTVLAGARKKVFVFMSNMEEGRVSLRPSRRSTQ